MTLCACSAGRSQSTKPADPAFVARLQDLDRRAALVEDLTATFEQEKHSALLKKPMVSRGTVHAKGSVMLWETTGPRRTSMRVDAKSLQLLYVDQKLLEVYPLDGKLAQLASSPLPRLQSLREQFAVEGLGQKNDELTLELTPLNANLKQNVDKVRVVIDVVRAVVVGFQVVDPDGELTVTRFGDVRLNTHLPDSSVELVLPDGTKTVHPLDATP